MGALKIIKWLALLVFLLAFASKMNWIDLTFLHPYQIWMMTAMALVAFLMGNSSRWLGAALFVFGLGLHQGWFVIPNVHLTTEWILAGGYLTLFLNSRY